MENIKAVGKAAALGTVSFMFEYDTVKLVHIKSISLGILNRLIQVLILSYVVGYVIVYEKGYQEVDTAVSVVNTKVKGVGYTNISELGGMRIWDVADMVQPAQNPGSVFLMTNVIVTVSQSQGVCPEDPKISPCLKNEDCQEGKLVMLGHGSMTGECNMTTKSCEIYAWCPVESETPYRNSTLFPEVSNFTILVKNSILFPIYNIRRRNVQKSIAKNLRGTLQDEETYDDVQEKKTCVYDAEKDPLCPIFRVSTIFEQIGEDFFGDASQFGSVVAILVKWRCDLDRSLDTHCLPEYSFRRIDATEEHDSSSQGFNFRYAQYTSLQERTLFKAFGVLFVIQVDARAGKFSPIPLAMNFGAGLGLMVVATLVCDFFVLYLNKWRETYREKKYLVVEGGDSAASKIKRLRRLQDEDDQVVEDIDNNHSEVVQRSGQYNRME